MEEKELECRKYLEQEFRSWTIDHRIDLVLREFVPKWRKPQFSDLEEEIMEQYNHFTYPILEDVRWQNSNPYEETEDIMIEDKLIERKGHCLEITPKGIRIFEAGGWLKHLEQIEVDKELERKNKEALISLTQKENKPKSIFKRIKATHVGLVFTLIFGTLAVIANWDKIKANYIKIFREEPKQSTISRQPIHLNSKTKQMVDTAHVKPATQ